MPNKAVAGPKTHHWRMSARRGAVRPRTGALRAPPLGASRQSPAGQCVYRSRARLEGIGGLGAVGLRHGRPHMPMAGLAPFAMMASDHRHLCVETRPPLPGSAPSTARGESCLLDSGNGPVVTFREPAALVRGYGQREEFITLRDAKTSGHLRRAGTLRRKTICASG